ncbi:MAG: polyprenyl synthetase family protein, partial [Nitrospirae bacterium]|nr:polyprenyl synthetase family protein [Nitrospirota bacterium]
MNVEVKARENLTIREVWDLYKQDLVQVEHRLRESFQGDSKGVKPGLPPFVGEITHHLFNGGGKRFRPFLVILSSGLHGYTGDPRILLAVVIEFIHTATLLHDDVIDDAAVRRGRKS